MGLLFEEYECIQVRIVDIFHGFRRDVYIQFQKTSALKLQIVLDFAVGKIENNSNLSVKNSINAQNLIGRFKIWCFFIQLIMNCKSFFASFIIFVQLKWFNFH